MMRRLTVSEAAGIELVQIEMAKEEVSGQRDLSEATEELNLSL